MANRKKENSSVSKTDALRNDMLTQFQQRRAVFLINLLLRCIVMFIMIIQFFAQRYENVALCVLTLVVFSIPSFLRKHTRIELPSTMELIALFFLFSSTILGEISEFYTRIQGWDTILHTINGFCAGAIGLSAMDILNRSERFPFLCSPFYVALSTFCFSMTIGVLWEFFEFGMDNILHLDMQKDTLLTAFSSVSVKDPLVNVPTYLTNITKTVIYYGDGQTIELAGYLDLGLYDTIKDLFVNCIGALVFAVFGYFYVKRRGNDRIVSKLIISYKQHPEEMLAEVQQLENEVQAQIAQVNAIANAQYGANTAEDAPLSEVTETTPNEPPENPSKDPTKAP